MRANRSVLRCGVRSRGKVVKCSLHSPRRSVSTSECCRHSMVWCRLPSPADILRETVGDLHHEIRLVEVAKHLNGGTVLHLTDRRGGVDES